MKKIFTLFVAVMTTMGLWASNVITYTATKQLPTADDEYDNGFHPLAFNVSMTSHSFSDGQGTITFAGELNTIGDKAFIYCTDLKTITIPDGVTSIGSWAFYGCYSLDSVFLGSGLTSIGEVAFDLCESLTYINLPEGLKTIERGAFICCYSLERISLPNSITFIGDMTFWLCTSLDSVIIPNKITALEPAIFGDCKSLTYVSIPDSVTSIGGGAFSSCESLPSIHIPDGVTSIGESAFSSCDSLKSINIPSSVTSIGDYTFSGCNSLPIENGLRYADTYLVYVDRKSEKDTFIVRPGTKWIGGGAFSGYKYLQSVTLPDGLLRIGKEAFNECTKLSSINIPGSVTSIGENAFYWCPQLASFDVDAANTRYASIDGVLLNYAKDTLIQYPIGNSRKNYTIPDGVEVLGKNSFNSCKFSSITLPSSLMALDTNAFYCGAATSLTCYAENPPACDPTSFTYVWIDTITLYVPVGSVKAYQNTADWKYFKEILPIGTDPTALRNTSMLVAPNDKILKHGQLLILRKGKKYNVNGQVVE